MEDHMNHKFVTLLLTLLFAFALVYAQDEAPKFVRGGEIPMPDYQVNGESGIGNMITGVDFDDDGRTDLFLVSHNWNDNPNEMTPRLYKYEFNGDAWEVVWACSLETIPLQNTWPALTYGDLDQDGKDEVIWGPVNYTDATTNPNPSRIVVFEEQEATGSDVMGVSDGMGNYLPNAQTTITEDDNANLRPFKMFVKDVDFDETPELVYCVRAGGQYFGVLSVSDIPDNGDGSETWTLETDGVTLGISAENKWDVFYMDSVIYLPDETQCDRVKWNGSGWELLSPQTSVLKGAGSWKSAVVADIDGNGNDEVIVGTWYTSVAGGHGVWIYQDYSADGSTHLDSLVGTKIADLSPYMTAYGVYGGALGDIDQNGKMDYVFGSRGATPNAAIFRLEYKGAQNSVADPSKWELSVIDSEFATGGRWGVIGLGNYDTDNELEVLYTSSVPAGGDLFNPDVTQPVVLLDYQKPIIKGPWVKTDVKYQFDAVFDTMPSAGHGIAVDKYSRIWEGTWSNGLRIMNPDGSEADFSPVDTITVPKPAGGDTTFRILNPRGLEVDGDGNIVVAKSGAVVKLDVDTGEPLAWTAFSGSPLKPAIDDEGYIYVGLVVGVTPVSVIDPATFQIVQQIDLPGVNGYARGMAVSADGTTLYPGNLDATIHPCYLYTTTDFVTYAKTDSILNDNMGDPIFVTQAVTVDRTPDGRVWYSQDNSYDPAGATQENNALVMFNFATSEYGYLYMPEPRTDTNGPRGAAWTPSGDTIYVAIWNKPLVYRYISTTPGAVAGQGGVPIQFELSQNYPNPFNPVTSIDFTIAKAGKTTLTVYNVLGQKVVTLVDRNMPMGKFRVAFDGSRIASGTYIYELKNNGDVISKKMTLLK
jgi:hypothetical protein